MNNVNKPEDLEREINVSLHEENNFPDVNEQQESIKSKRGPWSAVVIGVVAILCFSGGIAASRWDSGRATDGDGAEKGGSGSDQGETTPPKTNAVLNPPQPPSYSEKRKAISDKFYARFATMDYTAINETSPDKIDEINSLKTRAENLQDDQAAIRAWEEAITAIGLADKETNKRLKEAEARRKKLQIEQQALVDATKKEISRNQRYFEQLLDNIDERDYENRVKAEWKLVNKAREDAENAGEDLKAVELWESATASLKKAISSFEAIEKKENDALAAKSGFEKKRDQISAVNWLRYGGTEWKAIQALEISAGNKFAEDRYDSAKREYDRAVSQLDTAIPIVRERIKGAVTSEEALAKKRAYEESIRKAELAKKSGNFKALEQALSEARETEAWSDDGGSYIQVLENILNSEMQTYHSEKGQYDKMVKGFNAELLDQFGGDEWKAAKEFAEKGHEYRYMMDMTQRAYEYAREKLRDLPYTLHARAINFHETRGSWNEMSKHIQLAIQSINTGPNGEVLELAVDERRYRATWLLEKKRMLPFNQNIDLWMGDLGGGVFIDFKKVSPGEFEMGTGWGGEDNEKPRHDVIISHPFWLSTMEVTQKQYREVMGLPDCGFVGDKLPVEKVKWEDAIEFCRRFTKREHGSGRLPLEYQYTLPTEAQWEYACRAGSSGKFSGDLDEMGWYAENSNQTTHPVGMLEPNDWGFYDMHGNVWEWCRDFGGNYSKKSVTNPEFTSENDTHLLRGGSWLDEESRCRSASRYSAVLRTKNQAIGFRPVLVRVK